MIENKRNLNKTITLILLSVFVLVLSYFTVYENTHMIHECTGHDCAVCHELHIAEAFTKQVLTAAVIIIACLYITVFAKLAGNVISSSISGRTLIIDKVRIDD